MKKKISLILIVALLCALFMSLTACNKEVTALVLDGDIAGGAQTVNLQKIRQEKYTFEDDDGNMVKTKGWNLNDILAKTNYLYAENSLLITANDGMSVLIEAKLTAPIYVYKNDEGKLCTKGIGYPRAVGVKDISEITVVTKQTENISSGIKVLTAEKTETVSLGNAKLKLLQLTATNTMNGNSADKYLPAADLTVSHFTGREKNIAYFKDYDIIKDVDSKTLSYKQGSLLLETDNGKKAVYGFTTGTLTTIYDSFYEMKSCINNDKKVMFILPDGYSLQQAEAFKDGLGALNVSRAKHTAVSTNRSISPVALAAIVTGQSPYHTGIHFAEDESRAVLKPNVPDIFEYAAEKGKSVKYLEGSGNLIIASVEPSYGINDRAIYENAKRAVAADTDLIFVHFHEIDDVNHRYGALSTQSLAKVTEIDSYISDLMRQFDGTVIIVPDHGHNTFYDENNVPYGQHGMFTNLDMYVPYFVYE